MRWLDIVLRHATRSISWRITSSSLSPIVELTLPSSTYSDYYQCFCWSPSILLELTSINRQLRRKTNEAMTAKLEITYDLLCNSVVHTNSISYCYICSLEKKWYIYLLKVNWFVASWVRTLPLPFLYELTNVIYKEIGGISEQRESALTIGYFMRRLSVAALVSIVSGEMEEIRV